MLINKSCISAFSKTQPFVALATKSKLFDPSFSLTSELVLANYMTGKIYPPVTTDLKFCRLLWCETATASYLAAGHENGIISLYELADDGLVLLKSNKYMEEDVTALEYLPSKAVLVAGSCKGKVIFWTLTDLDKEYNLDIPLSVHITSIAWNAKVTKILCVGTIDGSIKVLDIKKNSVIMTLTNKDITEVRGMEWDRSNNTRLLVMSDRPYLTAFDLSNDSVTRIGDHADPLIGFQNDMLISKNLVEKGKVRISIRDAFDCSVSQRDSVVALSYCDGSTEILSVPVMPKKMPFFGRKNLLFTLGPTTTQEAPLSDINAAMAAKEIAIEAAPSEGHADDFYRELIAMVRDSKSSPDIAQFLLDKAEGAESDPMGWVDVDLSDEETMRVVKGSLEPLRDSDKSVKASHIYAALVNDASGLRKVDDFPVLLLLSKLMGDYSALSGIKNPRVLAAVVLFYDILSEPSLAKNGGAGGREFAAIRSLVARDFGRYIDNRMGLSDYHLGNLGNVDRVLADLGDFITDDVKLGSRCLIDYFWYKVFRGEYDDVKSLNIADSDVEYYNRAAAGLEAKPRSAPAGPQYGTPLGSSAARVTRVAAAENRAEDARLSRPGAGFPQPVLSASVVSNTFPPQSQMPPPFGAPAPSSARTPPFVQKVPMEGVSSPMMGSYPVPNAMPPASTSAAQPRPRVSVPGRMPGMPGMPGMSGMPGMAAPGRAGYPPTPQPQQQPITPVMGTQHLGVGRTGMPGPMRAPVSRPDMGAVQSGPSPAGYPGMSSPGVPSKSVLEGFARQRSPPIGATLGYVSPGIPQPQAATALEKLHISGASASKTVDGAAISRRFDALVSMIRERAAGKNSLIIKQRKNQHLSILAAYDTVDRSAIPVSLLEVMDALCLRMESVDPALKSDVEAIVSKQSDCAWLKAFAELVKLLY